MRFQCVIGAGAAALAAAPPVAPILYKNRTTCHRPGEIAPMPLLARDDARPPWHAHAPAGTFENERRLSDADEKTALGRT